MQTRNFHSFDQLMLLGLAQLRVKVVERYLYCTGPKQVMSSDAPSSSVACALITENKVSKVLVNFHVSGIVSRVFSEYFRLLFRIHSFN